MGVEQGLAVDAAHDARPWWESRLCLVLVVLATMAPLLYPPIPPLVDLFGHMGRYRVELDLHRSPWLQQYYNYHWAAIGNLGVDLLIIPLGELLGLEPAVKLIVLAIPPLTAIGFLWVAREVHGRIPPTAFFALPFIYGYPFLFGFVNFALSVALAFLAFGLWLRLGRLEPARPIVVLGGCGPAARPRPAVVESRRRSGTTHLGDGASDPGDVDLAKRDPWRPDDRLV